MAGKPRSEQKTEWKKPNWFGGNRLGAIKTPPGYVARWCDEKDDAKIERRLDEGWVFVNKTTHPGLAHEIKNPDHDVKDGSGSEGSVLRRRGMVAMMLPEELAEDRRRAVVEETERQTRAKVLMTDAKQKLGRHGASIKPRLVID